MITFEQAQSEILKINPDNYYSHYYIQQEKHYLKDVMDAIIKEGTHFKSVLDIGPGWGTLMLWLSEFVDNISVLDIIKPGVWIPEKLLEEKNVKFYHENIFDTQISDIFDIITMTQVIPHLKYNPIYVIQKIAKLINNDGVFITCLLDNEHHETVQSKYGKYWKALPIYGGVDDPVGDSDLVTAMYDRYSFFELLSYGFDSVSISRCESGIELLAVCKSPRRDI